jgi:hypothetical protein
MARKGDAASAEPAATSDARKIEVETRDDTRIDVTPVKNSWRQRDIRNCVHA